MSFSDSTPATTGLYVGGQDMNTRIGDTTVKPLQAEGRTSAISDPPGVGQNSPDGGSAGRIKFMKAPLRPQELAMDAVGVVAVDAIRRNGLKFDVKETAAYLLSSSAYQMFAYPLLQEALTGVIGDSELEYALGKVGYNALMAPIAARVFGVKTTIPEALMTAIGAQAISYGVGSVAFGGGPYVGPSIIPIAPPSGIINQATLVLPK